VVTASRYGNLQLTKFTIVIPFPVPEIGALLCGYEQEKEAS
jgi:hypothetical protein